MDTEIFLLAAGSEQLHLLLTVTISLQPVSIFVILSGAFSMKCGVRPEVACLPVHSSSGLGSSKTDFRVLVGLRHLNYRTDIQGFLFFSEKVGL